MIGKRLLHFDILEKLGEGGMGVVYKARDTHLDRLVAIKVLPAEKVADPERRHRFVQEAKAASALNHPNIIHIYDIDQAEGIDFIVMEFVAGETLDALIPSKGMRLPLALKYAVQVADALARAHGAGIVHRDLKPSNVMVDEHGLVKVLDFGLAKLTEAAAADAETATMRTGQGVVLGTAAYMSPEQAEGKQIDSRSDVFGFGSMFYEMLTGQRAFQGDTAASTIASILREEPKPISQVAEGLPRDAEKIVRRCLRKDPEHRFQHMDDLKVALVELKEDSDSGKLDLGVPTPARSPLRQRLVYGVAATALLPVAAVLAWRWMTPPTQTEAPKLVPLTTYTGYERYPSFSPDGQQVAFDWNGETEDNRDIYVKFVGETNALRLTTDPAAEWGSAWSPDGKRIAFRRNQPGAPGVWMVSPLGGAAQKLAELQTTGQMSWSPDGKWLAVGAYPPDAKDVRGIVLVPVDGSEPRRITARRAPAFDAHPTFSPDGRRLAFASCASQYNCDVFVQQIDSEYAPREAPRRITEQNLAISGLAWSRDGEAIIYSGSWSWDLAFRLWRVRSGGAGQPERIESRGLSGNDSFRRASREPAGHSETHLQRRCLAIPTWRSA